MDARWKNLFVLFIVIALAWFAWQWFQTNPVTIQTESEPTPAGTIDSFENGRAVTMAILQSVPGFDQPTGSFVQPDVIALQNAKTELEQLVGSVQSGPGFDEKQSLLSFLETWLRRVELELAWSSLKEQSRVVLFSGTETDAQVCEQKNFFELTRARLETARMALQASTRAQTDFVTGFFVLALQNGFENSLDTSEEQVGLQHQIELIDEIVGACP